MAGGSGDSSLRTVIHGRRRLVAMGVLVVVAAATAVVVFPFGADDVVSEARGELAPAPNDSSLSLRTEARASLTAAGEERLAMRVTNTTDAYAGANHTRQSPFETDATVIENTDNGTAVRYLLRSEDVLVTTALADAEQAQTLLDSHGTSYDSDRVTSLLRTARDELREGRRFRPDDPTRALQAYRRAYERTQTALSVMDSAFEPRVRLTSRSDPIGSLGGNRTLSGRVVDIRVNHTERVRVSAGGETVMASVDATAVPLRPGQFAAQIHLPDEPVTVTAAAGEGPTATRRFDGDGLADTFEANRTDVDALTPDTDGDGRLDGRETFTSRLSRPSLNATIALTGKGNVAGETTVRRSRDRQARGTGVSKERLSPVLHVEPGGDFERATVRLQYDGSRVTNESAVAVYRFDDDGVYRRLNSTVYPENDTVVAHTTRFSEIVALDTDRWESPAERRDGPAKTEVTLENDFEDGQREHIARGEIRSEGYDTDSRSLRTVDDIGTAEVINTSNFTLRARFKTEVLSEGWLTILDPYNERITLSTRGEPWELFAFNFTEGTPEQEERKNLGVGGSETGTWYETVVRSRTVDGRQVIQGKVWPAAASEPSDWQVTINATEPGGDWLTHSRAEFRFSAPDSRARIFLDEYNVTTYTQYADSDGDGLRDGVESQGMLTPGGHVIVTDPQDPDTDDDGTPDGAEMGDKESFQLSPYSPAYDWSSNPIDPNSDDSGVNDTVEYRSGTDPFSIDRSLVMAKVPTRADSSTGAIIEGKNGGRIIEPAEVINADETQGLLASAPEWLDSVYGYGSLPDEIPSGQTYALVDIPVYVASENTSATPQDVKLEFTGNGRVVAAGYRPGAGGDGNTFEVSESYVTVEEGVNIISAVVVVDQIGPRGGNFQQNIGNLELTVRRKPQNPFGRPSDASNDAGWSKTTITTEQSYTIQSFGADNVMRIYEESVTRLETVAISGIGLNFGQTGAAVSGGAEILLTTGAVSGGAVEAGAIFVTAANVACSQIDPCPGLTPNNFTTVPAPPSIDGESFEVPTEDPRRTTIEISDWKSKYINNKQGVRTVWYKYTGVALIRQN